MSVSIFMYEGDGLMHAAPRSRSGGPATGRLAADAANPADVPVTAERPAAAPAARLADGPAAKAPAASRAPAATAGRATEARRGEAMRSFFPKIGAWLAERAYFARMREVEHYLAQATDAADLEQRIRRLERGPALLNY